MEAREDLKEDLKIPPVEENPYKKYTYFNLNTFLLQVKLNLTSSIDFSFTVVRDFSKKIIRRTFESQGSTAEKFPLLVDVKDRQFAMFTKKNGIDIWEYNGKLIKTIGKEKKIYSLVYSEDEKLIYGEDNISIFNPETEEIIRVFETNYEVQYKKHYQVSALTLLENNKIASSMMGSARDAIPGEGIIHIWDRNNGKLLTELKGHTHRIISLALASLEKNKLISASLDGTIKIWNLETQECEHTFQAKDKIFDMAIMRNSLIAVIDLTGKIYVWDIRTKELIAEFENKEQIADIHFAHDIKDFVNCTDERQGEFYKIKPRLKILGDGRLISSYHSQINIWNIDEKCLSESIEGIEGIYDLVVLKNDLIVAVNNAGKGVISTAPMRRLKFSDILPVLESLIGNSNVKVLIVKNVDIFDKDLKKFIEIIEKTSLIYIDFENTKITREGKKALQSIKKNIQMTFDPTIEKEDLLEDKDKDKDKDIVRSNQAMLPVAYSLKDLAMQPLIDTLNKHLATILTLIEAEEKKEAIDEDKTTIKGDENLSDFYFTMITHIMSIWLACQVIQSGKIDDNSPSKLKDLESAIELITDHAPCPGVKMSGKIINFMLSIKVQRDRKQIINNTIDFFRRVENPEILIERIARELTLIQIDPIQKMADAKPSTTLRKAMAQVKKLSKQLTADNINTPVKEFAIKQSNKILNAIYNKEIPEKAETNTFISIALGMDFSSFVSKEDLAKIPKQPTTPPSYISDLNLFPPPKKLLQEKISEFNFGHPNPAKKKRSGCICV